MNKDNINTSIGADDVPEIEKGVPLPSNRSLGNKWSKLAAQMEPGDSVLFPPNRFGHAQALRQRMRRQGLNASCRKVNGGWRVWKLHGEKKPYREYKVVPKES